jgi:prevent-host-death family protein
VKSLDMNNATGSLADYARGVSKEPVILTRRGKPVAALVSVKNTDLETASLSVNPLFLAVIERSRVRRKVQGPVSSAEMRRRFRVKAKGRT